MKSLPLFALLALVAGSLFAPTSRAESTPSDSGLVIKNNERIAFLGDSITQFGANLPGGYVRRVISGLKANGITAVPITAGVSGNKSNQMLERLDEAVISKKPDWLTLSCGVNDVMHGANGIPLEPYKVNITAIVDKAQAAGIKVMILTATMIGEDAPNGNNVKLAAYNDFLRQLAQEKKCLLADLNADMQAAIKPGTEGKPQLKNQLTRDGVHMNPLGDEMMALGVLKAFGMDEKQLEVAKKFWIEMPEVACEVTGKAGLTLRQYQQLNELAAKDGVSVDDLVNQALTKTLQQLAPAEPAKP